ncbi:hypothetical protein SAMN04488030_0033 [Aliiroseovarius halocynthiae]|nr:hypothetical protein SAMN04488030_0033 [Aliiroseovarius halocynthiae]
MIAPKSQSADFSICLTGIRKKSSDDDVRILISSPMSNGSEYFCEVTVEGVAESQAIYADTPLDALVNAGKYLQGVIYPLIPKLREISDDTVPDWPQCDLVLRNSCAESS